MELSSLHVAQSPEHGAGWPSGVLAAPLSPFEPSGFYVIGLRSRQAEPYVPEDIELAGCTDASDLARIWLRGGRSLGESAADR